MARRKRPKQPFFYVYPPSLSASGRHRALSEIQLLLPSRSRFRSSAPMCCKRDSACDMSAGRSRAAPLLLIDVLAASRPPLQVLAGECRSNLILLCTMQRSRGSSGGWQTWITPRKSWNGTRSAISSPARTKRPAQATSRYAGRSSRNPASPQHSRSTRSISTAPEYHSARPAWTAAELPRWSLSP